MMQSMGGRIRRALLLAMLAIVSTPAFGQFYSDQAWDLKQKSHGYDEQGRGKAMTTDGKLNVIESGGGVGYTYPLAAYSISGYPIKIDLNYCGSVGFTAFVNYSSGPYQYTGGASASAWRQFHQNRPAWIIGVNGFAAQMIGMNLEFHSSPSKVNGDFGPLGTRKLFTDRDFLFLAEGYDFANRMKSFYQGAYSGSGGNSAQDFVDVIRILRADGSMLELHNSKRILDPQARFTDSIYVGYYHTNEANSHAFGVVSLDMSMQPQFLPTDSAHFTKPRILRYYPGDGLEYVFREYIIPYGAAEWRDLWQTYGGQVAGPTIFYLEGINSNAGALLPIARARHKVDFTSDPNQPVYQDSTRGRAAVTDIGETRITYDYNSLTVQALGRTTLVKFDTVLASHGVSATSGIPLPVLGTDAAYARSLAKDDIGSGDIYQGFLGYVTEIVDPEHRVTKFDYERVRRRYIGFGFPKGGTDESYSLYLENVRLKEVTEPTARYVLTYKATPATSSGLLNPYAPDDTIPIYANSSATPTVERWLLNDMVEKLQKYDCNRLLRTDEYTYGGLQFGFPNTSTHVTHAITDNVTNKSRWLKYDYRFRWLPDVLPKLPKGRFTEMARVADSIPGYCKATETEYDSLAPFTILPKRITEYVNGIATTRTETTYQLDTARWFDGDGQLVNYFGKEVSRKDELKGCACDSSIWSTVIAGTRTTTYYKHLPESSSGVMWYQVWGFDKIRSFHNYDSMYSVVINGDTVPGSRNPRAPKWEEVMYRPGIGVYTAIDSFRLIMPPVYGLETKSSATDGRWTLEKSTTYATKMDFDTVPRGRMLSTSMVGYMGPYPGWGPTWSVPPTKVDYIRSRGQWFTGRSTNAVGAVAENFYRYYFGSAGMTLLDSGVTDPSTAHYLSGKVIDDHDSTWTVDLADGEYFSRTFEVPSAARQIIRKPGTLGGWYRDTLESFTERTFYGLASGTVDANGWLARDQFDHNGRLRMSWMPHDFSLASRIDTMAYTGLLSSDMSGYSVDTLVYDSVNCDPNYTVIIGPPAKQVLKTYGEIFVGNPVVQRPPCPSCVSTKQGDGSTVQARCIDPVPYEYHTRSTGVLHVPILPNDASQVTSLDSAYLLLMINGKTGSCINLNVSIPQFGFSKTYVFNCPNLDPSKNQSIAFSGGKRDGSVLTTAGDHCSTAVSADPDRPEDVLKVSLQSIKDSLLANAVRGREMTVYLKVSTSGAEVRFASGYYEDYRPQLVMKGGFKSFKPHEDFTLAYHHIDDSLKTYVEEKVDDSRHTASNYGGSGSYTSRHALTEHRFGADYRVNGTFATIGNPTSPVRVDSIVNTFDGNGGKLTSTDAEGNVVATAYDAAGRPVEVTNADGSKSKIAYYFGTASSFGLPPMTSNAYYGCAEGFCDSVVTYSCDFAAATVKTNENGIKFVKYTDALGRLRREVADSGGPGHLNLTTTYDYDGFNRMTKVTNPSGDEIWYTYDLLGRVRYKHHPDLGTVSYAYDDLGNVRFVQNQGQADSNRLTFTEYDDMNRVTVVGEAMVLMQQSGGGGGGGVSIGRVAIGGKGGRGGKSLERSALMSGPPVNADTSLHRLTDTLNARSLHIGTGTQPLTYNTTLMNTPVIPLPIFAPLGQFDSVQCGLTADTMLGEVAPPIGPFLRHPINYYTPIPGPKAGLTDFEDLAKYPHFVRMAIAYDAVPSSTGAVWSTFPTSAQWDSLAPKGKVRNLRGRTSAIAYREHGGEPYHYVVQSYDERGRVEALLRWTENLGFDAIYYTYNSMNRVISVRVADWSRQYTTFYGYDYNGRVDSVWGQLSPLGFGLGIASPRYPTPAPRTGPVDIVYTYGPNGNVTSLRYPSVGVLVQYAYNHRLWLDSMVATQGANPLFKEVLTFDPTGQIVTQRSRQGASPERSEIYRYDSVQRIVAWVNGTDSTRWTYDNVGNRSTSLAKGAFGSVTSESYSYGGAAGGPNRLDQIIEQNGTGVVTGLRNAAYDANGATVTRTTQASIGGPITSEEHFAYSFRDLTRQYVSGNPSSIQRVDWRYRYSPNGEREQKRLYFGPNGDENGNVYPWVYYLLGGAQNQLAVYHGQQTQGGACNALRAVYLYPAEYLTYGTEMPSHMSTRMDLGNPLGTKEYRVADHLGSIRSVVTSTTVQAMDYDPHGNRLLATPMRKGHNDRELDFESRLAEHGVRKYDGLTGRFIRGDRYWEKYYSVSPYQYANNNPMRLMDPTGDSLKICDDLTDDEKNKITNTILTVAQTENQDMVSADPQNKHVADAVQNDDREVQVKLADMADGNRGATDPIERNGEIVGVVITLNRKLIMGSSSESTKAKTMAHELEHASELLSPDGTKLLAKHREELRNPEIPYEKRSMEVRGIAYGEWFFSAYHKVGGPAISLVGVPWIAGTGACIPQPKPGP